MRYVSLCSGVGGADRGLDEAGLTCVGQVEIEKSRRAVLARHWPDVPRMGDIKDVRGDEFGPFDLALTTIPCKNFSKARAGGRDGLAGKHGSLFFEFVRIARLGRPRWVFFENVPGLLSSNGGRDFGAVLGSMDELGFGVAWRVLDSGLGFGLPQRRRRLVLLGVAGGDAERAARVLHHTEGSGRDPREDHQARSAHGRSPGAGAEGDHRLIFRKSRRAQTRDLVDDDGNVIEGDFETWFEDTYANCLTAWDVGDVRSTIVITEGDTLRRLTPVEHERLMGLPDDWTLPLKGDARSKACGDAVTVPMARWVGERIAAIDKEDPCP